MMKNLKVIFTVVSFSLLIACNSSSNENAASKTQVAAKVNNEEITIHQINQVLRTLKSSENIEQKELMAKALDSLVNQAIIVQKSKEIKLDRDVQVMQSIEMAKRKILVDSYIQRTLGEIDKPSQQEIEAYYTSNPEIFNQRKLFVYKQVVLNGKESGDVDTWVDKVKEVNTIEEFSDWLREKGVDFRVLPFARTSESIPESLRGPLNQLNVGDVGFLRTPNGLLILELESKVPQKVELEIASNEIARHLMQQKQNEAIQQLMSRLRDASDVEYLGDFVQDEVAIQQNEITPERNSSGKQEDHIDNGLKGLN